MEESKDKGTARHRHRATAACIQCRKARIRVSHFSPWLVLDCRLCGATSNER